MDVQCAPEAVPGARSFERRQHIDQRRGLRQSSDNRHVAQEPVEEAGRMPLSEKKCRTTASKRANKPLVFGKEFDWLILIHSDQTSRCIA